MLCWWGDQAAVSGLVLANAAKLAPNKTVKKPHYQQHQLSKLASQFHQVVTAVVDASWSFVIIGGFRRFAAGVLMLTVLMLTELLQLTRFVKLTNMVRSLTSDRLFVWPQLRRVAVTISAFALGLNITPTVVFMGFRFTKVLIHSDMDKLRLLSSLTLTFFQDLPLKYSCPSL